MSRLWDTSVAVAVQNPAAVAGLPPEAEFIISALEAGAHAHPDDRRAHERRPYRVRAALRLFSDDPQAPPWQLFVRDISPKGMGFVTRHRLPLGYGGIVAIASPLGRTLKIDCTLVRCRLAAQEWFEGSMYFNREQSVFIDLPGPRHESPDPGDEP